jgi:broad specificity phosphatase PhoE
MRLIFLRHGQTGLFGRYVGSTDVPLSEVGQQQIEELRPIIGAMNIDTLLVSPMLRCTQTADLLDLALVAQVHEDLREIDFGRWEGKSFAEIEAEDPELVQKWADGDDDFRFPEGEGIASFIARVELVKIRLLTLDGQNVLVVAHGGVIRSLICGLLGLSWDNYMLFQVAKGHYSTIDLDNGIGVLTGFNLGERREWAP